MEDRTPFQSCSCNIEIVTGWGYHLVFLHFVFVNMVVIVIVTVIVFAIVISTATAIMV